MIFGRSIILLLPSVVFLVPALELAQAQSKQPSLPKVQPELPIRAEVQPEPPIPAKQPAPAVENQDELFEEVFGKPRTRDGVERLVVPFFINEQDQGQVIILLSPGGIPAVRLQAAPFLEKAAEILRPDIQEKLQAAVDREGNLTLEVLQQNGLEATFDQRQLELQIQVPPALRRTSVYNLREGGLPPEAEDALPPSKVSGYINLRGGQDYVWSGKQAATQGRQPLRLDLEGAFNFKGWVVEGSSAFTERADPSWVRGDLSLVRDAPAQAVRYIMGDLSIPITGYQSSRPMVGITVARNFALQPYRVTRPVSQFEFFLESPSRVEVFVNGRLTQTLQLPAGPQDIRDLPLNSGTNDVQLIITSDVGRVQRLNFPAAVAGDLLAPGIQQFAYSFGFPSSADNGLRIYRWGQPTLSLSHRWGLSNTLTMGGYLQGDPGQQIAGIEGVWATSFGNLGYDAAFSHARNNGADSAFKLRYDYIKAGEDNPSQRAFGFILERRGARFTTLDELALSNDYIYDLSGYYRQQLFWGISSNLSASYQLGRARVPAAYRLALTLSKGFRNGLGVNLNLSHRQDRTGQDEQRAYLSLFWLLPGQRQSILATTDISNTSSPTNQITWNSSSRKTIGGIDTSVGVATSPDGYGLTGRLDYTGYRAIADLSNNFALPGNGSDVGIGNTTRLTFGTALVFTDGYFGWSRPVSNSFALVIPHKNLEGRIVGINPGGDSYIARADKLGPAVVPDLESYYVSTLRIDTPDLPLGYGLGPETYNLLPSYKSGTLIRVGTEATVFLRGTLLHASGEPVSLQTGEITSLSDSKWKPITLFTNKAGRFAVEGFKPGRYEFRLFTNQQAVIRFEVPPGQAGLYDIGTLRVPAPATSN